MQKAILTFEDAEDGQLHISMEFEPEVSEETRSSAVSVAIQCMDFITKKLGGSDPE